MLSRRRPGSRSRRNRTDLSTNSQTSTPNLRHTRNRHTAASRKSTGDVPTRSHRRHHHQPNPIDPIDPIDPTDPTAEVTYFNELNETNWVLRNRRFDRDVVQQALQRAASRARASLSEPPSQNVSPPVSVRLKPTRRSAHPQPISPSDRPSLSNLSAAHPPPQPRRQPDSQRRSRDRTIHFRRARRPETPVSASPPPSSDIASEPATKFAYYDSHAEHHWRLPRLRSPRKFRILSSDDTQDAPNSAPTPWYHPTPEGAESRPSADRQPPTMPHHLHHHHHRSDRRTGQSHNWRDDLPPSAARDRVAKRLANNGARWRGLLARKDLVDGKADAYCTDSNEDITPRSSFDIEEATSLYSWEADPPSTSVRDWRSNHSLSYRPRGNERPRHIRVIGRQRCINDLADIVDAANEPCVSYDRQIFDPVSKLWKYVEASMPSSSPWELRMAGSPITCSVSGTEEAVSTAGRGGMVGGYHGVPRAPPPSKSVSRETSNMSKPTFQVSDLTQPSSEPD